MGISLAATSMLPNKAVGMKASKLTNNPGLEMFLSLLTIDIYVR